MKKVLLSVLTVGAVGAIAYFGYTRAFFSDTETSKGNTLQAGALDLKIDSQAHYAGLVCEDMGDTTPKFQWQDDPNDPTPTTRPELIKTVCKGTWSLKDLAKGDTFIDLADIKPGDGGENTISLHVFDNDAYGRVRISNIVDNDVSCTEPEIESGAADPECQALAFPGPLVNDKGELSKNLTYSVWLDEGKDPGFQCYNPKTNSRIPECDPTEGDNVRQDFEPSVDVKPTVGVNGELIFDIRPILINAYKLGECTVEDGHTNYGACHGLALDGRFVGSATYYFGVAWQLDSKTGNEAQTDSLTADISFDVEQQRNNANPFQ